jgi:hypothetical protein
MGSVESRNSKTELKIGNKNWFDDNLKERFSNFVPRNPSFLYSSHALKRFDEAHRSVVLTRHIATVM